jgi:hypothetical protein
LLLDDVDRNFGDAIDAAGHRVAGDQRADASG